MGKRDNFNGDIYLEVTLELEPGELEKINQYASDFTNFKAVRPKIKSEIKYFRRYTFKDSKYTNSVFKWSGLRGILKTDESENYVNIDDHKHKDANNKLALFCRKLIPSILYLPNFVFEFPSKIPLIPQEEYLGKEHFYVDLIQDILYSLENDTNIKTHLIERITSDELSDKRNLNSLLQKMSRKVTDVIFKAWNEIFKRELRDTKVNISSGIDKDRMPYIEFVIETQDNVYQINERSLGFRWFFTFLLFTQ